MVRSSGPATGPSEERATRPNQELVFGEPASAPANCVADQLGPVANGGVTIPAASVPDPESVDSTGQVRALWALTFPHSSPSRHTFHAAHDMLPLWSPDRIQTTPAFSPPKASSSTGITLDGDSRRRVRLQDHHVASGLGATYAGLRPEGGGFPLVRSGGRHRFSVQPLVTERPAPRSAANGPGVRAIHQWGQGEGDLIGVEYVRELSQH